MSTAPLTDAARLGDLASARRGVVAWLRLLAGWLMLAAAWGRGTARAIRHHRFLFVVIAVVDAMVLAAIGNTYFYYRQPELVASVGPMWNPDVQKYLFVLQVCCFAALLLGARGVRAALRRRTQ